MTKEQEYMVWAYNRATATDIWEAYSRPSRNKVAAYKNCRATMQWLDGYAPRITGAGSYTFSIAFKYRNKDDGREHLYYITKTRVRDFAID